LKIDEAGIKLDINDRSSIELVRKDANGVQITPTLVNQFSQGPYDLHNLSGNAAEMVAERGSTKGGSYGSSGYYLKIDAEDEFKGFKTSPYVGFRYVAEIIER